MKGFGHRRCTRWLEWSARWQPLTNFSTGSIAANASTMNNITKSIGALAALAGIPIGLCGETSGCRTQISECCNPRTSQISVERSGFAIDYYRPMECADKSSALVPLGRGITLRI
jgi:hypothetical protein